jgi:hypothetical protein
MATKKYKITFLNGKVTTLTTGEMNAIERFAHQNGTDPEAPQYDPGNVHYRTRNNLVDKGILRRDERGMVYFVEGLLAVQAATIFSNRRFSLSAAVANPKSTDTTEIRTLEAEKFKPGFRYWPVLPGHENAWTIRSVEVGPASYQVWRDGKMITPDIVTITRRDGNVRTLYKGEKVAIQGPWQTED